jgi:hypothetical protein
MCFSASESANGGGGDLRPPRSGHQRNKRTEPDVHAGHGVEGVTNAPQPVAKEREPIVAAEGCVECDLNREAVPGVPVTKIRADDDGKKAFFYLANAYCAVYYDEDKKSEQVERLTRAIDDLQKIVSGS